jgi:N-acetylglucosamine-1-phosphate transferase gamma subunit
MTTKCLALLLIVLQVCCLCAKIDIKIVEAPILSQLPSNLAGDHRLLPLNKVQPAPYAGPAALAALNGKCFDYTASQYKWVVCPFQNVSQIEQVVRWNAYRGVIGIFFDWTIVENRFGHANMLNGDECGNTATKRRSKVRSD